MVRNCFSSRNLRSICTCFVIFSLPKQFYIPMGVDCVAVLNRYDGNEVSQAVSEVDHSTKNSSFLKSSKSRQSNTTHLHQKQRSMMESEKGSKSGKKEVKVEQFKT